MATPLTLLGFYRNTTGTADYGAARARTDGSWHMVRKQYGDNLSTYSYAKFTTQAAFDSAINNLDGAPWVSEPYSNVDYTLILLGLTSPIPASTSTAGAVAAVSSGASTDVSPVVNAIGTSNTILSSMLAGQSAPGGRSSETTQLKVLAALLNGLVVSGQVSITNAALAVTGKFYPDTQAVSGPLTDAQLRAGAIAVSLAAIPLAAGAASTQGQLTGNTSLASIDTKLATVATAGGQADQNTKLEAIRVLLGATSTAALQTAANNLLQSIVTAGATAAGQNTLATKQDTANSYLQTLAQTGVAVTASAATPFSMVTTNGSNATVVRAGTTWLLGGTVSNSAAAWRYLFIYNSATMPAVGAAAPTPTLTIAIPPGGQATIPVPALRYLGLSAGLCFAAATKSALSTLVSTAAVLGTDTGLTAGEVVINLSYAN